MVVGEGIAVEVGEAMRRLWVIGEGVNGRRVQLVEVGIGVVGEVVGDGRTRNMVILLPLLTILMVMLTLTPRLLLCRLLGRVLIRRLWILGG